MNIFSIGNQAWWFILIIVFSSCHVFSLKCKQILGHRVCEIPIDLPPSPNHRGISLDFNFSSPSKKLQNFNSNSKTAKFTSSVQATIQGETNQENIKAINFCMDRVSENWISTIGVRVLVEFKDLGDQGILGAAQPTRNWIIDDFIYPVGLAESILEDDLNDHLTGTSYYDIIMRLNTRTNWYKQTDALPKSATYDMVTVCLHEVYHGLLFTSTNIQVTKRTTDGIYLGRFISNRYTSRFDAFMGNQDGCSIQAYENDTEALGLVLTGNNLFFVDDTQKLAQLHAPRPYISGSSLYHLSEIVYAVASGEDLMTPAIGTKYAQHNIGDIVYQIQSVLLDIDTKFGAKQCSEDEIRPPIIQSPFDQGIGEENGKSNSSNNNFTIRLGNIEINGWIIVAVGIGIVIIIIIAGIISFIMLGKKKLHKQRRTLPLISEDERPVIGHNGGGLM